MSVRHASRPTTVLANPRQQQLFRLLVLYEVAKPQKRHHIVEIGSQANCLAIKWVRYDFTTARGLSGLAPLPQGPLNDRPLPPPRLLSTGSYFIGGTAVPTNELS